MEPRGTPTHGVTLEQAPDVLADKLALMATLWNNDVAGYHGRWAMVEPSWSWPKPRQQPCPPIHLGGRASVRLFHDAAQYGNGWLPIEGYGTVLPHLSRLRDAFEQAGRSRADAVVSVYSSAGDPEILARYAEAGIDRVIIWLPPADRDTVWNALDIHTKQLAHLLAT